jgi:hypothetical protein
MEPVMMTKNRASAHSRRGGNVRIFKRLFSALALILLTSVVLARPAGLTKIGHNPVAAVTKSILRSDFSNPPNPRLDFGTVVRDTADDHSFRPSCEQMPSYLPLGVPRRLPAWVSLFVHDWASLLLVTL